MDPRRDRSSRTHLVSIGSGVYWLGTLILGLSVLAGCGGAPAPETEADILVSEGMYVDWDYHDWLVDRFVLIRSRGAVTAQGLGQLDPLGEYLSAINYTAPWDSLSLVAYLSLSRTEQAERRHDAMVLVSEARGVVRGAITRCRNNADGGFVPNIGRTGATSRRLGTEAAVTTAIGHFVAATGIDPSNAGAWRDLAYFCGNAGDRGRQQRALAASLAALDQRTPGLDPDADVDADRLRRDVLLDLAWLARDLRQPAVTIAYLDHVASWLETPSREREERRFEALLLRGLALADQGEWLAAMSVARDLPRVEVTMRTLRGSVREDLRWQLNEPQFMSLGFDRSAWPRQLSDFGRRWIKAVAGAPSGDRSHTLWLLGAPPTHLEFPARLASRYWQDQGTIRARAGEFVTARHCFTWAALYRPYMAFFPLGGSDSESLLSDDENRQRYYIAYGAFFLCGDRNAFERDAATIVMERARAVPSSN